jgi:hypothetical protein
MESADDKVFTLAVRDISGDYIFPNGVTVRNPDVRDFCEGVLTNGVHHNYPTQGRALDFRPTDLTMPARARVLCEDCREREAARDAERAARRAARHQVAATAAPPPARSAAELLADMNELLGDNPAEAA